MQNTTSDFVTIDDIEYYKISNSENLSPFFIQVPSSSDIWIFLSSNGGLTAGRRNAEGSIFPYETDDKLALDYETGSKTLVKINGKLWQPFEQNGVQKYNISRNIYKSLYANSVILEEINHDLQLTYSYKYESSEKFGIVKTSKFTNDCDTAIKIEVLDGLSNILPYGVLTCLQADRSTLIDAYKAAELATENLAVYTLTTEINDTPHPIEMMRANIAYNTLNCKNVYLTPDVVKMFKNDEKIALDRESYGAKCGYFIVFDEEIKNGKSLEYSFVVDNGYDHCDITKLCNIVETADFSELFEDIKQGTKDIISIVEKADGLQSTGDKIATATHYLNTLYNCMRGGIFADGYNFDYNDFEKYLKIRNKSVLKNTTLLEKIKNCKDINELKCIAKDDKVLYRLALEYMPISFSRRHGDPSRPWNKFNIAIKDKSGNKTLSYEGNWRDIFQNWEALGLSYPSYFENMVAKFVNASTFDGFNPYRINNEGIDWEKPEEDDPFSGLGYWGDHQIIYLLRLLQALKSHYPEKLQEMLSLEIFSYANVPYVLNDYKKILKNSKSTIAFDAQKDNEIENIVKEIGTDGKLILKESEVLTVSLCEKLIVPVLSKISNLLVGGGIWMNTERPEWNDANNAIVGIGLSMVTTYHVSAYLDFLLETLNKEKNINYISKNVVEWLKESKISLEKYKNNYAGNEKALLDLLGEGFSNYRKEYYKNGLGDKIEVENSLLIEWIEAAKHAVDYTISKNCGDVYSSYNLLNEDFSVSKMRPMLEGQSAVIGSGFLTTDEVINLVNSMKNDLYSEKLKCHTLYPTKKTKKFLEKNVITLEIEPILGIISRDVNGKLHFDAEIKTEEILLKKCKDIGVSADLTKVLIDEYEKIFAHKKFNGRSEVMYKFEGIGCVYWHQNAKFTLAILETALKACQNGENIAEIYKVYNNLMQGFIYRKSPIECGAIPIEPYSHTSFSGKSEQPGMTGQVKESILMRRIELGVTVSDGEILFYSEFLKPEEFDNNNEVSFTLCGIPVKYRKSNDKKLVISLKNDEKIEKTDLKINSEMCKEIFNRTSEIKQIEILI